jgi:hypothetical protein
MPAGPKLAGNHLEANLSSRCRAEQDGLRNLVAKTRHAKSPVKSLRQGFFALTSGLRQGVADGAERIADLRTEQAHDSNHDYSDESKNDRIFDEALAFFFRGE